MTDRRPDPDCPDCEGTGEVERCTGGGCSRKTVCERCLAHWQECERLREGGRLGDEIERLDAVIRDLRTGLRDARRAYKRNLEAERTARDYDRRAHEAREVLVAELCAAVDALKAVMDLPDRGTQERAAYERTLTARAALTEAKGPNDGE